MKIWRSLARAAATSGTAGCAAALFAAACASIAAAPGEPVADGLAGTGLVDVQRLTPGIDLDIRYAGSNNFVGAPVDGYEAPRCYLLVEAARALAAVEADLRTHHMRLRVFDCYRPVRAVQHFMAWAHDLDDQRSKPRYYPNVDKSALVPDYIADRSGHSRGATVDLTLMQCDMQGRTCVPVDMGTEFDFFDERAHTDAPGTDDRQRANRGALRDAMERHGFRNYPLEWWHYTFQMEPAPETAFDVPVK
ncbi:M15 family metallopeptidase [Lysobacter niastensis]|nr:M15 family metallopeptidase [Lysobacter niastensis]